MQLSENIKISQGLLAVNEYHTGREGNDISFYVLIVVEPFLRDASPVLFIGIFLVIAT